MVIRIDIGVTCEIASVTTGVDTIGYVVEVVALSMKNLGKGLCKDPYKSTTPPNEMGVEVLL